MPDLQLTGRRTPAPWLEDDLQSFYGGLRGLYETGTPLPPSPEQQVAPLDPMQMGAIGELGEYGAGPGGELFDAARAPIGSGLNMAEVYGYADNPYLNDQITAALRDPYRQFTEQTMPGIDFGASTLGPGAGNRSEIARGIAERGYADRASDVAAQMRGDAYGTGLRTALGTRQQDQSYIDLANQLGLSNIGAALTGGGLLQENQQSLADAGYRNWEEARDRDWRNAANYAGLVLGPSESFGYQYGQPTPGFWESLGGGVTGGLVSGIGGGISDWIRGLFN